MLEFKQRISLQTSFENSLANHIQTPSKLSHSLVLKFSQFGSHFYLFPLLHIADILLLMILLQVFIQENYQLQ